MDIARELVVAKVANQATILRRFGGMPAVVKRLRSATRLASTATSTGQLFGIEGRAAAEYFAGFPGLLAPGVDAGVAESFPGRVGRGATDPLNIALNYRYGMLLSEVIRAVLACGLDPHAGVLHSSGRNKPALALDLMEEFRPPWWIPPSWPHSTMASWGDCLSLTCSAARGSPRPAGAK